MSAIPSWTVYSIAAYISELHHTQLAERRNDLAAYFIGDIKLGQRHVLRPEQRFLLGRHLDGLSRAGLREECGRTTRMEGVCEMKMDQGICLKD